MESKLKCYSQILLTDGPCYNQDQSYMNNQVASTPKANSLPLDNNYNQHIETYISQIPLPEGPHVRK